MVVDINATLPAAFEPLINTLGFLINTLNVLVGGIFGLYLILIFLRWKEARDVRRILSEIRDDIKLLNEYMKKKK